MNCVETLKADPNRSYRVMYLSEGVRARPLGGSRSNDVRQRGTRGSHPGSYVLPHGSDRVQASAAVSVNARKGWGGGEGVV